MGAFNALIRLLNPTLALLLGVSLALGTVLLVLGHDLKTQRQQTTSRRPKSQSGRNFITKKYQHPPQLTLWQQIACLLFPGFRAKLARQRFQRPSQKRVVIPINGENTQAAASSTRSKTPKNKKLSSPPPPRQPDKKPVLDQAMAQSTPGSSGQSSTKPGTDAPAPRLAFGLPRPKFDLAAVLDELDELDHQKQQAELETDRLAQELQQDIRPAFGLPLFKVERQPKTPTAPPKAAPAPQKSDSKPKIKAGERHPANLKPAWHLQYDEPIGPEPAPPPLATGADLIDLYLSEQPPILHCPFCNSRQVYGNGGEDMACPACGEQFHRSQVKKRSQKRKPAQPTQPKTPKIKPPKLKPEPVGQIEATAGPTFQYDAPIGPEPDLRLMYDTPAGPPRPLLPAILPAPPPLSFKDPSQAKIFEAALNLGYPQLAGWVASHDYDTLNSRKAEFVTWLENAYRSGRTLTAAAQFNSVEHAWDVWVDETDPDSLGYSGQSRGVRLAPPSGQVNLFDEVPALPDTPLGSDPAIEMMNKDDLAVGDGPIQEKQTSHIEADFASIRPASMAELVNGTVSVKQDSPGGEAILAQETNNKDYRLSFEGDWSWVQFEQKPAADVLTALKSGGARWGKKRQAWYFKRRIDEQWLDRLLGAAQPVTEKSEPDKSENEAPAMAAEAGIGGGAEPLTILAEPGKEVTDDQRPNLGLLPERAEPGQPADQPGADHSPALAAAPAPDVPPTGTSEPTGTGDPDRRRADPGSSFPAIGTTTGTDHVRGMDGRAPRVGDPALGGGTTGIGNEPDRVGATAGDRGGRGLTGDYRITAADQLGVGGAKQKYRDNVAAIRLLKQLEAEGRQATPAEQAILVKYVGWGGLPKVFDPYETYSYNKNAQWKDEYYELRDLLTDEEYTAARGSTTNAHYTAPGVISAMWQGLHRLGFTGGRVLEPAAGVGHFFGLMPSELAANSHRIATELDSLTGRIARQLYPNADVRVTGFENSNLPNNFIDLAISNVPFGNYGIHDPEFKRERKFLTRSIHNYFFAKALDKVKPGGVVAFVTSRFTLDSKDAQVREYLAGKADLVGAIRLPNTAFKENAMTDVTTDIIFLRKRAEGDPATDTGWVDTVETTDDNGKSYRLNEYFRRNPAMLLGKMEVSGNMYRDSADLVPDGRNLTDALAEAMNTLPADLLKPPVVTPSADTISQPPPFYERRHSNAVPRIREGSYFVGADNRVYRRQNGFDVGVEPGTKSAQTTAKHVERVRRLTAVRAAARDLLDLNLAGASDAELETGQASLNAVYDAFTTQFGPIHLPVNSKAIADDPDLPVMLALERYDRTTKTAQKAAIFRERVIGRTERPTHASSAKDALLISLNEYGELNWARMEELTGQPQDDLAAELGDILYLNPEGSWETAETYLSGNIRQKLAAAEAAAAIEPLYQRNVAALRNKLPRELAPTEIWANLGAGWIPDTVVQQFVSGLLRSRGIKVQYIEELAQWTVEADKWIKDGYDNNNGEWATARASVLELIEAALNARTITIYDTVKDADGNRKSVINQDETLAARAMQGKIKDRFAQWVWEDEPRAAELAAIYNEQFNALAPQQFDGSHLSLPGTAADISLRSHQKNAIWRILQGGNTLLAHQVGAGKTFTMIAAGMELRRLGLRKKVMHIVLNSTLDQYAADFQRLYPGARVLVLDAESVSPARRKETMSRIATEDWDAIITSHTSFEKLPVQDETFNGFLREQITVLEDYMAELRQEDEKENRKTIKELEKAKKRLEAKLRDKRDAKEKDNALTWEELGVDHLFVDEAHKFKNLYFPTKRGRVAGIGGSESGRAFDLFIKTRAIAKQGGLTLATGTPIANSVSEMYTMQRYLQYNQLKAQGLGHFDAWANMFGDTVTAIEMKPTGSGYRQFTRFAKFNNVPELLRMYHQTADVQMDLDTLGIVRPKLAGPHPVSVEPSERLQAFIKEAEARADNLSRVDPRDDNMLKIVSDAGKAALDMRLIDVELPDDPNSKVNALVDRVADIYQRTSGVELPGVTGPQNLTQMIFLDTSTPGDKDGFNVYQDIKGKLVKANIPEAEIAFIHDAKTDEQRLALFERMNAGEIRVLLGSTEKAGTGVNVQRLLYALHHLDAPWRPADIEQREGRILRQGNLNPNIEIYRYVTAGSFDVFKWQTLETKAKFISQINNGDMSTRSIEDVDAAVIGYAEMKAIASGNPVMLEKIKVEADVRKYEGLFNAWQNRRYELQRELQDLPRQVDQAQQLADSYRELLATRNREGLALLEPIGAGLAALGEQAAAGPVSVGNLFNRPARVRIGQEGPQLVVTVAKGVELGFKITSQDKRNVAKLQDLFGPDLERRISEQDRLITELERTINGHQAELNKPFEHTAALSSLHQRQAIIRAEIDGIEASQPQQVFDDSTFGPDTPERDEDNSG